jgi:hypothetical protein
MLRRAMGTAGQGDQWLEAENAQHPTFNVRGQSAEDSGPNSEINLMDGDGDAAFYFLRETDDVPIR